jgi:formylglycine-generating enzyme
MKTILTCALLFIFQLNSGQAPENMVWVPSGNYHLTVAHQDYGSIKMNGFYMDKFEVTMAQFEKFVQATGYKTDAEKKGFSRCKGDTILNANWRCTPGGQLRPPVDYNKPVVHISSNDALAYAKWAGKRLPTEAEWMYVASHIKRKNIKQIAWFEENALSDKRRDVQAVGKLTPNSLGIFDLWGNVWELVLPHDEKYKGYLIAKGRGFWCFQDDFDGDDATTVQLVIADTTYSGENIGFRCVKDI